MKTVYFIPQQHTLLSLTHKWSDGKCGLKKIAGCKTNSANETYSRTLVKWKSCSPPLGFKNLKQHSRKKSKAGN